MDVDDFKDNRASALAELERRKRCVLKFQAIYRRWVATREMARRKESVVAIQARTRMKATRRRVASMHAERDERALLERHTAYFDNMRAALERDAVVYVQAHLRGALSRPAWQGRQTAILSAVRIQAHWRGRFSREKITEMIRGKRRKERRRSREGAMGRRKSFAPDGGLSQRSTGVVERRKSMALAPAPLYMGLQERRKSGQ